MAVAVLDQVQMLDQEIAPARAVAEQRAHLGERLRLDLAAFGRLAAGGCAVPSRGFDRSVRASMGLESF